jgi:general secretion pathway protein C
LYIDQSGGVAPLGAAALPPGAAPVALSTDIGPGVSASQVSSDVSFTPRIDGGRVTGLVVRAQGNGAAFRAIGFKDGDVVTAAGGRAIAGPADLDRVLAGLTPGSNLSITVERGAQTLALVVTIRGQ